MDLQFEGMIELSSRKITRLNLSTCLRINWLRRISFVL